jgi:hypothetical protein
MVAIALALAASLAWGASDFLAGVKTRELAVVWVLLVSQATGLVLVTTRRPSRPASRSPAAPRRCGRPAPASPS